MTAEGSVNLATDLFRPYRTALLSRSLTNLWRGHGSAIFLEFGCLSATARRDGTPGPSHGEYTLMIEWSWRIEEQTSVLCGSWSDEELWSDVFATLVGRTVLDVSLEGRLPEVVVALEGGLFVTSFMTAQGQPAWTLFRRGDGEHSPSFLSVVDGEVQESVR